MKTSFIPAVLCFTIAVAYARVLPPRAPHDRRLNAGAWALLGACYVLTQFGGDWFLDQQRAYFRTAVSLVMGATLWPVIWQMGRPLMQELRDRLRGKHLHRYDQ